MRVSLCFLLSSALLLLLQGRGAWSVSLYEYYAPGGVVEAGLVAEGDTFTLNNQELLILSGAFHYFRVHPDYWRATFRKLRAAGLNTIETYAAWNLHEPRQGEFDFGNGTEAMSPFLDVKRFVQMAQEEDLFVIFRPGPYICSEWDFGGMPSYLLRDYTMQVRTYYENFRLAAARFFDALMPQLADLQFTRGGPIIAVQVENEYGHFGYDDNPRDTRYLEFLRDNLVMNGFGESLFFTSDTPTQTGDLGSVPGELMTANFKNNVVEELTALKQMQPDRPLLVTEFWTGWFDHWLSGIHSTWSPEEFRTNLEMILSMNSSVNFYMFIGGTSFGFMAGANMINTWPHSTFDVSSYDYDAILSEAGDYSAKYNVTREVLAAYNPLEGIVDHPQAPPENPRTAYPSVPVLQSLDFFALRNQAPSVVSNEGVISMEEMDINNNNGQAHGYVTYTTNVYLPAPNATLKIRGHVRDMAQVLVDGEVVTEPYQNQADVSGFGFWNGMDQELTLPGSDSTAELCIMVENLGRNNYGKPEKFKEKKGLWEGPILVNDQRLDQWDISAFEFKPQQLQSLTGWTDTTRLTVPGLYRMELEVTETPQDTWLDMRGWGKGVAFVNGFNLGRYWEAGPPHTLYLPAPLLNQGTNEFVVFEQYDPADSLAFTDSPILSNFP